MYRASFRRKPSAVPLCKSIESAIQWFEIHHGITFVTILNPAVYLSVARVSISLTLVPRLVLNDFTKEIFAKRVTNQSDFDGCSSSGASTEVKFAESI